MPGARAVAGLIGEPFGREVFGYFEVPFQMLGRTGEELVPEGRLGNRVEREIATDDGERFSVFLYAFLVEFVLENLPRMKYRSRFQRELVVGNVLRSERTRGSNVIERFFQGLLRQRIHQI